MKERLKYSQPHLRMLFVKTITNAWHTSSRMHEDEVLPCIFGCNILSCSALATPSSPLRERHNLWWNSPLLNLSHSYQLNRWCLPLHPTFWGAGGSCTAWFWERYRRIRTCAAAYLHTHILYKLGAATSSRIKQSLQFWINVYRLLHMSFQMVENVSDLATSWKNSTRFRT